MHAWTVQYVKFLDSQSLYSRASDYASVYYVRASTICCCGDEMWGSISVTGRNVMVALAYVNKGFSLGPQSRWKNTLGAS